MVARARFCGRLCLGYSLYIGHRTPGRPRCRFLHAFVFLVETYEYNYQLKHIPSRAVVITRRRLAIYQRHLSASSSGLRSPSVRMSAAPSPAMAPQHNTSMPKRPRLSLQIKTSCAPPSKGLRGYPVNPSDPTTFNTLSNVYVTAIERSSSLQTEPLTAINTLQQFSIQTPVEPQDDYKPKVVTPYVSTYPETPLTAEPVSPERLAFVYPSTMTATPPLSAGAVDSSASKVFTFSSADTSSDRNYRPVGSPVDERTPRTRITPFHIPRFGAQLPYAHPRSLHSILRNSPLPPRTAIPPPSPRRQSVRLQEKAAKKVEYDSPLEQEITTFKYVRSHIDLLTDDASPSSPAYTCGKSAEPDTVLDIALAFTANEIQDGGQTPGPFEEMRRRMAGLGAGSPVSPENSSISRKRKRIEKKRQWVWTIGQDDDDDSVGGAIAAVRAQAANKKPKPPGNERSRIRHQQELPEITYLETPTPSIESTSSLADSTDVEMSDTSSVISSTEDFRRRCLSVPSDSENDAKTPIAASGGTLGDQQRKRDTPIPELAEKGDSPDPVTEASV